MTVDRTNPPITKTVNAPADVMAILRRSYFDCHANETHWPWYSYVAPMSWLFADDVKECREELKFSQWDAYSPQRQAHKIEECAEKVSAGEIPLCFYLPLHLGAVLHKPTSTRLPRGLRTIRELASAMADAESPLWPELSCSIQNQFNPHRAYAD